MSMEEYKAYHFLLTNSRALATPKPPSSISENLKKEFSNHYEGKKSNLHSLLTIKIPLWCMIALGLFLFGVYNVWISEIEKEQDLEVPPKDNVEKASIVYLTDTIYKEVNSKPIYITKEVEKIIYVERKALVDTSAQMIPQPIAANEEENTALSVQNNDLSFFSDLDLNDISLDRQQGRSIAQDKDLMNFLDQTDQR